MIFVLIYALNFLGATESSQKHEIRKTQGVPQRGRLCGKGRVDLGASQLPAAAMVAAALAATKGTFGRL